MFTLALNVTFERDASQRPVTLTTAEANPAALPVMNVLTAYRCTHPFERIAKFMLCCDRLEEKLENIYKLVHVIIFLRCFSYEGLLSISVLSGSNICYLCEYFHERTAKLKDAMSYLLIAVLILIEWMAIINYPHYI